jgi:tetratricopeptide (TPR) repeat protein
VIFKEFLTEMEADKHQIEAIFVKDKNFLLKIPRRFLFVSLKFHKPFLVVLVFFFYGNCFGQTSFERDSIPPFLKFYNEGLRWLDSADYTQAIGYFRKSLKLNKNFQDAMNKLALASIRLKDYKTAEKELDKSWKTGMVSYETIKLRAINFLFLNRYSESRKMFDSAVYYHEEDKMEDAELFYYRAMLMYKGKAWKDALSSLDNAIEYNPRYIEAWLLKGEVRFATKEYRYAIRELDQAISLMDPLKPDYKAYKIRAKCKFETGDYKGAVKDWTVYLEAFPNEEEALVSRAAAKINMNDNSGAIADLDEAIKINPENAVSYCYRGVAKGGNKSYVEALKDLDYSIELKFNYPAAYVNRAAIKMAIRDKRGACSDLEKADSLGDEMAVKLMESYCRH